MTKPVRNEINRGQAISFRIPSDTPDHILKHLQKLKETERRNFSSKMAEFVLQGVNSSYSKEKETITLPLPKNLTKAQRDWLKHEHSEALLGSILYHLITDPVRSTALLASLNSSAVDIDEALYLQEDEDADVLIEETEAIHEVAAGLDTSSLDDDLDAFDWDTAAKQSSPPVDEEDDGIEPDIDDLLGGFLANMNK